MSNFVVMIVDDDPTVLYLHSAVVKKSGLTAEPVCLKGGADTLEYFLEHDSSDTTYLVLLDINMPGMSGWELMDVVANRPYAHRVFFLIVTSSIDQADRRRALDYRGVVGFFEKPISAEELLNVLAGRASTGANKPA